jgi:hypothetical protein
MPGAIEGITRFNPAPFFVLAVVFGFVAYLVSRNYGRRHGVTPWHMPSWVWGVIGFFSLALWGILILIAVNTTKKPGAPGQDQWPEQPPYPGTAPGSPTSPTYGAAPGITGAPGPTPSPTTGPPPYPGAAPLPPPGWYPDPSGRHQSRYWEGTTWTEHVGDGTATSTDPVY